MNRKYTEKILSRIRNDYYRRMDAKDDEGRWVTTEKGNHIHFNDGGAVDKGNQHVVKKMTESGSAKASPDLAKKIKKTNSVKSEGTVGSGSGEVGGSAAGKPKMKKAVMTTDMGNTDGGVAYPTPKKGAKWLGAIKVAQETATGKEGDEKPGKNGEPPKVEPGTWDKTIAKLTDKDIVYQKDSDGNEVACIPGLAAMADNKIKGSEKMRSIWEKAVADSKGITADMLDIAPGCNAYMYGLENCVKGASHFEDKVKRLINKGAKGTPEEVAETRMGDAVRFTAMCDNDNVVDTVNSMCDGLRKKGYEIIEIENKFLKDDGTVNNDTAYKAVHIGVKSPNGRVVELQVHTPQTQEIKNSNHKEYDKQNDMEKKKPKSEWGDEEWKEYRRLNDIMVQRWRDNYQNPPGIENLKSFKKK